MDNQSIDPLDALTTEQIAWLANEIANIARGARFLYGVDCDGREDEAEAARLLFTEFMRVGWIADKISKALGGGQAIGDVDRWLLPPVFHDAAEGNGPAIAELLSKRVSRA